MAHSKLFIAVAGCIAGFGSLVTAFADTQPAGAPVLDAVQFLAPPPQAGSSAQTADAAAVHAARSPGRIRQAARDNAFDPFDAFSGVLGPQFTAANDPATARVLQLLGNAITAPVLAAKDHWRRKRPFVVEPALPVCAPVRERLRDSGSYPSGHSAGGWAWALALAELRPDQASAILERGRDFGESRIVCAVHWPSDVAAGQLIGAGRFAQLQADPAFREMMEAARLELARTLSVAPGAAVAQPPASAPSASPAKTAPTAAAIVVKVLLRTIVSGDDTREAIIASGELAPGGSTGRHTHPGDEYATLVEGELEVLVEGQPAKRIKAGEAYHNGRDVIHETRNVGSGVARLVSTFVVAKGQPIAKPANGS